MACEKRPFTVEIKERSHVPFCKILGLYCTAVIILLWHLTIARGRDYGSLLWKNDVPVNDMETKSNHSLDAFSKDGFKNY